MGQEEEALRILNSNAQLRESFRSNLKRFARVPSLQVLDIPWEAALRAAQFESLEGALSVAPALERVIKVLGRPALLVIAGRYEVPLLDYWYNRLEPSRARIERALQSVGRVEILANADAGPVGTAWLVAPGVAVTNRHVALAFARNDGAGQIVFKNDFRGDEPIVMSDFRQEHKTPGRLRIDIEKVLYIAPEPGPDVAILKLRPPLNGVEPAPIALDLIDGFAVKREVVALGFPMSDPEEDPAVLASVFGNVFWKKRVSPGEVTETPDGELYFSHDCSTLGGSSGSVVYDFERGVAVGLHFRGYARKANHAVRASEIVRILRDLKVTSLPAAPVVTPPSVLSPALETPRRRAEDYADRGGYRPDFLGRGLTVPAPTVKDPGDLVRLVDSDETELKYTHFSLVMSAARRMPVWTAVNIHGKFRRNPPRINNWSLDPRIDRAAQVGGDYYGPSKADRGHMVRRLDPAWGEEDFEQGNEDTFHYTNACPQVHRFNDGIWNDLEDYALAVAGQNKISVFTGPEFADDDFEEYGVKVPSRFWKVIARKGPDGKLSASAFRLSQEPYLGELEGPQTARFWRTYQVSIRRIERDTRLDFGSLVTFDALGHEESFARETPLATIEDARF